MLQVDVSPFRKRLQPLPTAPKKKYGCLMAILPESFSRLIVDWCKANIDPKHLMKDGWSDQPHVTIKYGFVDDLSKDIEDAVSMFQPFTIRLLTPSLFKGNEDGDVLKLDVTGGLLFDINRYVSKAFACEDKYPVYKPHLTLAYLDPKFSASYTAIKPPFLNTVIRITRLQYSTAEKKRINIDLEKNRKALSWLSSGAGADLVKPAKFPKTLVPISPFRLKFFDDWSAKSGFTGRLTDKRGRKICYQDGRRVPCNQVQGGNEPRNPAKEKPKRDVAQVQKDIEKFLKGGTKDPQAVGLIADEIFTLTVKEIQDLRKRLNLKAKGKKSELAEQLADQMVARANAEIDREGNRGQESEAKQPDAGSGDGAGSEGTGAEPTESGGRVEGEAQEPTGAGTTEERQPDPEPAGKESARRVPAKVEEVNRRLDRFEKFFRNKGQHQVADWMGLLRNQVNATGTDAALQSLGMEAKSGKKNEVQYWGVGTEEANWKNMGHFIEAYLARNGIATVTGDTSSPDSPLISALGKPDRYVADQDFKPIEMHYKNKLDEAKDLPGLEKSEDISKIMGKDVTHLTPEVTNTLDERFGKGQWIVKCYDDNAAAGYGIFFPQRVAAIVQQARDTIWQSGGELAKYGFSHLRDKEGKIVGIKHQGGDEYKFDSDNYKNTIQGDARHWADRALAASASEQGAILPEGSFMAQPAFQAVGISDAERAAGKTWHEKNEGRVHLVTRPDGNVEVVPHSTWLKGGNLPVVFEDDDTRAMAKAAQDAISKLPLEARKGQVYAPDIMKTPDGYRVVELNAQGDYNGSGYLHDNHFTIDAYTSHLTGRTPLHVQFIRNLLTTKVQDNG